MDRITSRARLRERLPGNSASGPHSSRRVQVPPVTAVTGGTCTRLLLCGPEAEFPGSLSRSLARLVILSIHILSISRYSHSLCASDRRHSLHGRSWGHLVFPDSTSSDLQAKYFSFSFDVLAWVQSALQSFRIRRITVGPLIRYPSNIVETID